MRYTIQGEIAQTARLDFERGEAAWVSRGALMSYTGDVDWTLRVPGGIGGAVRRSLAGEGISLAYLQTEQTQQYAMLASNAPGHIAAWNLAEEGPVVATRGSFLAAWGDIDITATVARRVGAAFFGGAGLFLQRISGTGIVLIHGSGDFQESRLADGEPLLVSTGNLAAFSDSVDYDIQSVGTLRKALFGGEGIFLTRLSGPGRVLLQTLKRQYGATQASSG